MIYMNNAATSFPKPDCVGEAMLKAVNSPPSESLRGGFGTFDVFAQARRELSLLLHAENPSRIALGCNATWALNTAIFGLDLKPGDTVVSTKAEHNSVLRPLCALRKQGVQVILVNTDQQGRADLQQWEAAIRQYRPQLAVLTHATNVTGAVNDPIKFSKSAREVNCIFLLDCSQTIGCIPINTEEFQADMVAFTGHKYLLGPQGTGGLWVREGLNLKPYLMGGTGIQSDLQEMPESMPIHLEAGTGNEPSYYGLLAALQWQRENPPDRFELYQKTEFLSKKLQDAGALVINPPGQRTPVVSCTLPGISASEAGYLLSESCEIACRTGLHCAPRIFECLKVSETVRLSLSRFTQYKEIEAVIQAVEAILS